MLWTSIFLRKIKGLFRGHRADDGASMAGRCLLLQGAEFTDCTPLPRGSNDVYVLLLRHKGQSFRAVYKPRQGEAPLYDFPWGTLYQREYAAYLVSQALEWFFIPPTAIREGPLGVGMVQWFITASPPVDYAVLLEKRLQELQRVAAFDWLTNNADRKSGHCLEGVDGKLWLIDHGLTFHAVPKLRTVLWNFSGQAVPEEILADLGRFQRRFNESSELRTALQSLLSPVEVKALEERLKIILMRPVFPEPHGWYYHRTRPFGQTGSVLRGWY